LPELNHLELQFLLLNDFRLSVAVEELEAYGTMLVEFYAREVIAQRQASAIPADMAYPDDITMTVPTSP
jgi:PHO85 cyclin-6/7